MATFTYDPNGNLLNLMDARGNSTGYTYNSMDRVATRTDPLTHSETFDYDLAGNLASHTDRKGQTATFNYDALNRRTGSTYVDATVTFTYDAANRVTQIIDSVGGTITNTYDTLDRLTSQGQPSGTVSYTYDAARRRATMTVPNQSQVTYAYDNSNRLTSITQGSNAVQFAYDNANRRTSLTLLNGVSTEYGYDVANRLTSLLYKYGGSLLGDLEYTYDSAGQRLMVSGSWARTGLPQPITSVTYNANNQQTGLAGQILAFDFNGNLVADGVNQYFWNARNWLIGVSGPVSASFSYDATGRRRTKVIGGTTTSFLHDARNLVQEQTAATTNLLAGPAIDALYVRTDGSGAQTYVSDALGSTVAMIDASGVVQGAYTYEPFGATSITGATLNAYDYTSREADATGLKYYRARYYHPTFQRFISEDPIAFRGGDANLYTFVRNNPLLFKDPTGLYLCSMSLPGLPEAKVDDSVAPLIADFVRRNDEASIPVTFNESFRPTAYQEALQNNPNAITPAPAGTSLHEAGFAVDVNWSQIPRDRQNDVVQNASSAGLSWGGSFRTPDRPHFYVEVPGGRDNRAGVIERAQDENNRSSGVPPCP